MRFSYKKIALLFLLIFSFYNLFGQESAKQYSQDEFPEYAQEIRRFEIITFGSLPFVFLDSVIVYAGIKWGMNGFEGGFPNIFNAQSGFNSQELTGIVLTSLGISLCIAVTDLIINRSSRKRTLQMQEKQILVLPEELNPPATAQPEQNSEQKEQEN